MIIQVEDSEEPFCNQLLNAFCHGRLTNTNFKIDKGILSNFKVVFQNDSRGEMKLVKKGKVDISLPLSKEQLKYLDN